MTFLIYKLNKERIQQNFDIDANLEIWKPSLSTFRHSRLPSKYLIWWFYHYMHIFRNKNLQVWLYYINQELAHFFCIVPKYYRWPFMNKNDVQITYVITTKKYRGNNIAFNAIGKAINKLEIAGDIWYVTDSTNYASQKLAEKLGFELFGNGERETFFRGLVKILKVK